MGIIPVASTPLIQMAANQFKCYVTWIPMVGVGPFFRDVWMAPLTSILDGNPTKEDLEIWTESSGSETTIFTVWLLLMTSSSELTWKTLMETSSTLSTRLLRWQVRQINTGFWLEDTVARLVTLWPIDISKQKWFFRTELKLERAPSSVQVYFITQPFCQPGADLFTGLLCFLIVRDRVVLKGFVVGSNG